MSAERRLKRKEVRVAGDAATLDRTSVAENDRTARIEHFEQRREPRVAADRPEDVDPLADAGDQPGKVWIRAVAMQDRIKADTATGGVSSI